MTVKPGTEPSPTAECPECACGPREGRHELWCSYSPPTLTMGELRELLTKAIELDGINETKRVGLAVVQPHWNIGTETIALPLSCLGVRVIRGEFVFLLEKAGPQPEITPPCRYCGHIKDEHAQLQCVGFVGPRGNPVSLGPEVTFQALHLTRRCSCRTYEPRKA